MAVSAWNIGRAHNSLCPFSVALRPQRPDGPLRDGEPTSTAAQHLSSKLVLMMMWGLMSPDYELSLMMMK